MAAAVALVSACVTPSSLPDDDALVLPLGDNDLRLSRALAHFAQGRLYEMDEGVGSSNALSHYGEAVSLDPTRISTRSRLAINQLKRGDTDGAIKTFEGSVEHAPDSSQSHLDLAVAYQSVGRTNDSIAAYEAALRIDPSQTPVYLTIASQHLRRQEDVKALKTLARGMKAAAKPADIVAYCRLQAKRFAKYSSPERSRPFFERLIDWDAPNGSQYCRIVAVIDDGGGHRRRARRFLQRALTYENPFPDVYMDLARLYERDGEIKKALTVVKEGLQAYPDNPQITFVFASILSREEEWARAVPLFAKVRTAISEHIVKGEPDQPSELFYLLYGEALERSGGIAEAERLFRECIDRHPDSHVAMNYLAYMLAQQNQSLDDALGLVERALEHNPESPAYLDTLGWVHFRKGNYAAAMVFIQHANELMPGDPEIEAHINEIRLAIEADGAHPERED